MRVLDGGRLTLHGLDGPGPMNLKLTGEEVKVVGTPGGGTANACREKFGPLPVR